MSILTSNMKVTKIVQKHFLCTFWGFLVTIICDVKIDISMCEPHYVNLFFFVNLLHSPCVRLFDILHLFDNLTSFWQLDIFFDIWPMGHMGKWVSWLILNTDLGLWGTWVMGHMSNGTHGQRGIVVNTKYRWDTLGMGPMGHGAMGHIVNVVMCWIMCNFLNTSGIFIKILLHIDHDVFLLNVLWFSTMAFFKYKNWWIWNSDWFQLLIGSIGSITCLANICYQLEFL